MRLFISIIKLAINIALLPVLIVVWIVSSFTNWLVKESARAKGSEAVHHSLNSGGQDFAKKLGYAAADFQEAFIFLDENDHHELKSRAVANYLEMNPSEKHFSASDFYLDAMVGALIEMVERNLVPESQSTRTYYSVCSFLEINPHYNTTVVQGIMNNYRSFLANRGLVAA